MTAAALDRWNARLALGFERRGSRTALAHNEHFGPLVVQKALHPEGEAVCQAIILHPPGGIAGGDHLSIGVDAGPGAFAQLTTPGAAKWYKANGRVATQDVRIRADAGSIVEWLPLESIVFDGAMAASSLVVDAAGDACVAGWDIVSYGRTAAGEAFRRGYYRQSIELRRNGMLVWAETGLAAGNDPLFASPAGFDGHCVSGLLWVMSSREIGDEAIDRCRDAMARQPASLLHGVTSLPDGVVLARCLAPSTEAARTVLAGAWSVLRPEYARRAAVTPRLWLT